MRLRAVHPIWASLTLILCISGCTASLQETLVGEWKGHLTMTSKDEMKKRAVTFYFNQDGTVDINAEDRKKERNAFQVRDNKTVIFITEEKRKSEIWWTPNRADGVLDGPVSLIRSGAPPKGEPTATLRLQRAAP